MDQEILTTLQEIRGLLFLLTTAICTVVVILFLGNLGRALKFYKENKENSFINELESFFNLGNYTKIEVACEEKLKAFPNHSLAVWWLAKAKYKLGKNEEAKKLFETLLELEPSWNESYIEPYLKKISG